MNKLPVIVGLGIAVLSLSPPAQAGRHGGAGHASHSFAGHTPGGHSRSFNHGTSFNRGSGSFSRRSAFSAPRTTVRGASFNYRSRPVRYNHRSNGFRTTSIANGSGRYRTGIGNHNNWGGRHHGPDHHSRHHHHDFGFGYGLAGLGLFGYPYGYGYGGGYYSGYSDNYGNGLNVADVQQALAEQGYYRYAIDGVYGHGTMQAIRAFQANNGLPVSGRIDAPLVQALGF
jgi:hypothetical protein